MLKSESSLAHGELFNKLWKDASGYIEQYEVDKQVKVVMSADAVDHFEVVSDNSKLQIGTEASGTTVRSLTAGGSWNDLHLHGASASVYTNGAERVTVDSAGAVGIGETSPSRQLHVKGSSTVVSLLESTSTTSSVGFYNTGGGSNIVSSDDDLYFRTGSNTSGAGGSTRLYLRSDGDVGIGETSTSINAKLHVKDDYQRVGIFESTTTGAGITFQDATTTDDEQVGIGAIGDNLVFRASGAGTGDVRIDSSGRMGVGINTLNKKFAIADGDSLFDFNDHSTNGAEFRIIAPTGKTAAFYLGDQTDTVRGGLAFDSSVDKFYIRGYNNSTKITIDSTGNIGVNTTIPSAQLEVNGFAKLGTGAPAIKIKKLTGTTAATEGGSVNIVHGLTGSKILSVETVVSHVANNGIPREHTGDTGYQYHMRYNGSNIIVKNHSTNSENILSKSITILVTYEE